VRAHLHVGDRDVLGEIGVRDQPPQLVLPTVAVRVVHAGDRDRPGRIDHDRLIVGGSIAQILTDVLDHPALEQDVPALEVADARVHRQHGRTLQQHPPPRIPRRRL
jgi:hypothetical protein